MRVIGAVLVAFAAVTVSAGAQVASPDQIAELKKKLQSAQAKVTSFRLEMSSPAGMTGIATVTTHPLRMHMQMAAGPVVMEMFMLDGYMYQRIATGTWRRQQMPATTSLPNDFAKIMTEATHVTVGPDTVEGGTAYGTYEAEIATAAIPGAPSAPPMQMTCTYDKSAFLIHSCKNAAVTETFVGYNDPNNTVIAPPELANAVDAGPLLPSSSPAPQASPKP